MKPSTTKRAYCPSCGEEVDVFIMIAGGEERPHCSQCGLILDEKALEGKKRTLDTVFIAEDSYSLRSALSEILISRKIAKNVVEAGDGREFLSKITETFKKGGNVNLVILDVNMPNIDGINAAKTLRALEDGFRRSSKVPILFFSVVKCDENFKRFLQMLTPSAYLNKGKEGTPEQLAERVYQIIKRLLEK